MKFFHHIPDSIEVYQVGGSVRDEFLDLTPVDYDFIVTGVKNLQILKNVIFELQCRPLPQKNGSPIYVVDKKKNTVKAKHDSLGIVDFKLVDNIDQDLYSRDFTINSISINCKDNSVYDPCYGLIDLFNSKLIIPNTDSCLLDSPERLFRGIRMTEKNLELSNSFHELADDPNLIDVIKNSCPDSMSQQANKMLQTVNWSTVFEFFFNHKELSDCLKEVIQLKVVPC